VPAQEHNGGRKEWVVVTYACAGQAAAALASYRNRPGQGRDLSHRAKNREGEFFSFFILLFQSLFKNQFENILKPV